MDSAPSKRKLSDSCSVSSTSSEESSDSDSSSSSDDERRRKKAKSSKKKDKKSDSKKKKKKDSKKKKKKKKDSKKKKKHKPDAEERIRQSKTGSSTGIFGTYGVIGSGDMYKKEVEFHTYLREIKKEEPSIISKREEAELWKDFCEDYNTATMPSEKYYDMRKWEMERRANAEKKRKKMADDPNNNFVFDDEEAKRREYAKEDEHKRHLRTAAELMSLNREKVADMKRQDQLKREMTLHYQTNNTQEVERIKKLLGPDNPEGLSWFDPD